MKAMLVGISETTMVQCQSCEITAHNLSLRVTEWQYGRSSAFYSSSLTLFTTMTDVMRYFTCQASLSHKRKLPF